MGFAHVAGLQPAVTRKRKAHLERSHPVPFLEMDQLSEGTKKVQQAENS